MVPSSHAWHHPKAGREIHCRGVSEPERLLSRCRARSSPAASRLGAVPPLLRHRGSGGGRRAWREGSHCSGRAPIAPAGFPFPRQGSSCRQVSAEPRQSRLLARGARRPNRTEPAQRHKPALMFSYIHAFHTFQVLTSCSLQNCCMPAVNELSETPHHSSSQREKCCAAFSAVFVFSCLLIPNGAHEFAIVY